MRLLDETRAALDLTVKSSKPDEREQRYNVAQAISAKFTIKTLRETDEMFYYDCTAGYYKPVQSLILEEIQKQLGKDATQKAKSEILSYLRDSENSRVNLAEFDSDPNMLHLSNCWLDIRTMKTYAHSEKRLSFGKLATAYNPRAKCPSWLKHLGSVLAPRDVFHMLQIIGYCLYPSNKFEKGFWWLGPGGNGKGKILEGLEALIGSENVSFQAMTSLMNDKFAVASLRGKWVNIDHDTSEAIDLSETSMIKKIISGNPINVRDMYQKYSLFRPRVKLIVSTNSPPSINTKARYADQRRLDVVMFTKTIPEDEKDVDLMQKLTTPEELSGLLNLALVGLQKLLNDGAFSRYVSFSDMARELDNFGNTVQAFLDAKCDIGSNYSEKSLDFYQEYLTFCKDNGKKPLSHTAFGGELAKLGIDNKERRKKGERDHYYLGVKVRTIATMKAAAQQSTF